MIIKDEIKRLTYVKAAMEAKSQKLKLSSPELSSHYARIVCEINILITILRIKQCKELVK